MYTRFRSVSCSRSTWFFETKREVPRFLDSRSGVLKAETENGVTVPEVFKEELETRGNKPDIG
jgi:hypothetical protein